MSFDLFPRVINKKDGDNIYIWIASIFLELHPILLGCSLFPDDDPGMNKTSSVFYCLLSGTGNVSLKSLLLVLSEVLTWGVEESSWEVRQNAVCNCLVFQKQAFLIIKDPF